MKLTKKTAGLLILYFLFQLFVLWGGDFFLVILLLIADAVLFYYMVANVMEKNRLRKGIQEIAAGNMSYQIPIDRTAWGEQEICIDDQRDRNRT